MNVPPVSIRSLSKRYKKGTIAIRDLTLSMEHGEILGIVGPNGAGKTTLIRQITTELMPTSGEVRVFGIDVVERPTEVKRSMGIMPQEATLYWGLPVHHQLRIFGKLRGLPPRPAKRRAEELLTVLNLNEHRTKTTEMLSGGLRRRVLLGIATVANPPLLILDEPSVGLDPEARRDLWDLLMAYKMDGKTVLLTTHYMDEAEALCDRVGIIHDGSLLTLDTVANLLMAYRHKYKISFSTMGRSEAIYGSDDRMLVQKAQTMGIDQYTVSRVTLEDVYLGLTGDAAGALAMRHSNE